jgi:hypothetical protein
MAIETFTQSQMDTLQKLDRSSSVVSNLRKVKPITTMGQKSLERENKSAFEAYWSLTREPIYEEIPLKNGEVRVILKDILVDNEMIKVANSLLKMKGLKQDWG